MFLNFWSSWSKSWRRAEKLSEFNFAVGVRWLAQGYCRAGSRGSELNFGGRRLGGWVGPPWEVLQHKPPTHACHYVKNPQKRRGSKLSKLSHQSEIQESQLGKNLLNQITARWCSGRNVRNERRSYRRRLLFPASHSSRAITAGKMALTWRQ